MRTVQLHTATSRDVPPRFDALRPWVTRLSASLLVLWLVAACEHAGAAGLSRPRPARLPPAAPPRADSAVSLPTPEASASSLPHALVLSQMAARFLALQYGTFRTEFMGCMIGLVRGDTLVVDRIAPADVEPAHSTGTWVVPTQTCERAGWTGVVGTIHSHVGGQRCWYFFPGTRVPSSDAEVFTRSQHVADAIMCGDRVVWIDRRLEQHEVALPFLGSPPP